MFNHQLKAEQVQNRRCSTFLSQAMKITIVPTFQAAEMDMTFASDSDDIHMGGKVSDDFIVFLTVKNVFLETHQMQVPLQAHPLIVHVCTQQISSNVPKTH